MNKSGDRSWVFRAALFIFIAMFLVWQVATRSIAAYLAPQQPEAAIQLRPGYPQALLILADQDLAASQAKSKDAKTSVAEGSDIEGRARIRTRAEEALFNDPLSGRAFRILGQLSDGTSDEAQTEKLMQAAARRSLRESVAVDWLMRRSYAKGDYSAAAHHADTLLRTRPRLASYVMPIMAKIAENPDAAGEFKKLLANNPPWRGQFFAHLPNNISDARTPLGILLSLRDTPTPPTVGEIQPSLNFLVSRKFYEIAYYTWLQFLSAEQLSNAGFLFNGSFEFTPSGLPFDWVWASNPGVNINIAPLPEKGTERALFVEFGHGRVDFRGATQLTMLAPGTYRFQGKYKGEVAGQRGLLWRITCAGGPPKPIGESPMVVGVAPVWKDFEFSFTVPQADCRAQNVQLVFDARSASERLVSGSIWYDELRIARAE